MNGKTLTAAQRKILFKNGIENSAPWRYLKTVSLSEDGSCASKNSSKVIKMLIMNIDTGEEKYIKC